MLFHTIILACSLSIYSVQSVVYNITNRTTNWQSILTTLKAGDVVNVYRGVYTTAGAGYLQLTLNGTFNQPIIIQAALNEPRPIIRCPQTGASAQNVLNVQGSNFMIKGLGFTQGSRGVRLGPAGMHAFYSICQGSSFIHHRFYYSSYHECCIR